MPENAHKIMAALFAVLALGVILVYGRAYTCPFIDCDDPDYVTANVHVTTGFNAENIIWACTATHAANWHPLTWLSHMLDCSLYGTDPAGHHVTSVLLHLANSLLLFLALKIMTGAVWRPFFVAALFALHPLHVESVIWVAERKDVLSALFWMLTMLAYARYVKSPAPWRYGLVLLTFTLGLMAKPMLVTLPFVLLLLDYWPLGRFDTLQPHPQRKRTKNKTKVRQPSGGTAAGVVGVILEKAPLLALSAVSCIITMMAQRQGGAVVAVQTVPFSVRLANALLSYLRYLGKMFWPGFLAPFYPYHVRDTAPEIVIPAVLGLLGITAGAVLLLRSLRFLAVGWLWYLGTLVPVIGLVQVGSQAMADRYTYIPLIGIGIIIAWGVAYACERLRGPGPKVLIAAGAAALTVCGYLSWRQAGLWSSNVTLFEHAAQLPENYWAQHGLGLSLARAGRLAEAAGHLQKALQGSPDNPDILVNLGGVYLEQDKTDQAVSCFTRVLQKHPDMALAHANLGIALKKQGRLAEAADAFQRTLSLDPGLGIIRAKLALVLLQLGRAGESAAQYRLLVKLFPDDPEYRHNLELALRMQGKNEPPRPVKRP